MDTNMEKRAEAAAKLRAALAARAEEQRGVAKQMVAEGVVRLLVSGAESAREGFFLKVLGVVNVIAGREETVFFTCLVDGLEAVKVAAGVSGLTLEEVIVGNPERYRMLVKGSHPGWGARRRMPSRAQRRAAARRGR